MSNFSRNPLIHLLSSLLPGTPPANVAYEFWKARLGMHEAGFKDESGVPWWYAPDTSLLNYGETFPTASNSAETALGIQIAVDGTNSHPALADTNCKTRARRTNHATGIGAGAAASIRHNVANTVWHRGSAAGRGGFLATFLFGLGLDLNGGQAFIGMIGTPATALAGDPSARVNMIGLGFDTADSSAGNWFLMHNDAAGTAVRVDSGQVRNATDLLRLDIACAPNDDGISIRLINVETDTEVVPWTEYTTEIPLATVGLGPCMLGRNGAAVTDFQIENIKLRCIGQYGLRR